MELDLSYNRLDGQVPVHGVFAITTGLRIAGNIGRALRRHGAAQVAAMSSPGQLHPTSSSFPQDCSTCRRRGPVHRRDVRRGPVAPQDQEFENQNPRCSQRAQRKPRRRSCSAPPPSPAWRAATSCSRSAPPPS
ncbi:hypothetical protein OsJ_21076 [Oryza sativa Japonica Group]|nr:hypothetical protein OsJ_21076 [Oryza sativa Japonica Group]